jgi:hypothetical protein
MRGWIAVDALLIASDVVFIAPHVLLMAPHPNPLPVRLLRSAQNVSAGRGNSYSITPGFAPPIPVPSPRRAPLIAPQALLIAPHPNPLPVRLLRFAQNVSAGRGNSYGIAPDFAPPKPVPSPRRDVLCEAWKHYGERVRVRGNPRVDLVSAAVGGAL